MPIPSSLRQRKIDAVRALIEMFAVHARDILSDHGFKPEVSVSYDVFPNQQNPDVLIRIRLELEGV
jgi:hypothetical protein